MRGKSLPRSMMYSYFCIQSSKNPNSSMISSCILSIFSILAQHLGGAFEAPLQLVNIFFCRVRPEGRADRARNTIALHERLCAVMPRADSNPHFVEEYTDIRGVCPVDEEGDEARFFPGLSDKLNAVDVFQLVCGVRKQLLIVSGYLFSPDLDHILHRFRQTYGACNIRSAGFKLERQFIKCRTLKTNGFDHFATALIRGEGIEPFFLTIQNTDSGRSQHFVSRANKKVSIQILQINRLVSCGLRPIYQYRNISLVGLLNHAFDRIDGPECV